MARSRLLAAVVDLFRSTSRRAGSSPSPVPPGRAPEPRAGSGRTEEVDPGSVGPLRLEWVPSADGLPDPGEIVWTWVPYEENDGRGKDRPVLIVAAGPSGLIGVQLTSRPHDTDHVPIGSGDWDGRHRESWVRIDRIFRVDPSGVRREASFLPQKTYGTVARALARRYGWSAV